MGAGFTRGQRVDPWHVVNGNLNEIKQMDISLDELRKNNNHAISLATVYHNLDIIKYLVHLGLTLDDIKVNNYINLHWAFQHNHFDIFKYFIGLGVDLDVIGQHDNYMLCKVCMMRQYDMVDYFISILTQDDILCAMRYLCRHNMYEQIKYLLEKCDISQDVL